MKLEQHFEVNAHIDEVWAALIDIERVAPCLPGAHITERDEDGTYRGTFEVRLGPTKASYNGTLKIAETDEAAHRAVLTAKGTDKRGQGGATATIVNTLSERDGMTFVHADTDFAITGRLARFSRQGMMEDISNRLLRDFANCLQQELAARHEEEELTTAPPAAGAPAPAATGAGSAAEGSEVETAGASPTAAATPPRPAGALPPRHHLHPHHTEPVNGFSLLLKVTYLRIAKLFGRRGRAWAQ